MSHLDRISRALGMHVTVLQTYFSLSGSLSVCVQCFEAAYRVNSIINQLHGKGMPGELLHSWLFVYYEVFLISKT